ncbi:13385_t:CDS:2 [Ambispora leptoticha]|uniref:13385_t:CDS:1 n=1 Tax=Ambispora leptoticha TaxID=144679 RepID=A0A9N9I4C9_9GLOM|nr:13385_t:CDS:2 [Ambispora leptoticha]
MVLLYIIGFIVIVLAILIAASSKFSEKAIRDPLEIWRTLARAGRLRSLGFTFLLGYVIPYTRGLNLRVTTLEKGLCSAVLKEERRIHNPLRSIHVSALCTFAETIAGLAVITQLSKKDHVVVARINCEAGLITGTCSFNPGFMSGKVEKETEVILRDATLETVAKVTVYWSIECKSE